MTRVLNPRGLSFVYLNTTPHIIDARSKQCKSQVLLLAPIPFILPVCGQITLRIRCPQMMILSHQVSKPRIKFQEDDLETHYHQ